MVEEVKNDHSVEPESIEMVEQVKADPLKA